MVNQFYDAEIIKEYVMRGNSAIVKCSIPSFVADFVQVVAWADEDGVEYTRDDDYSLGRDKSFLESYPATPPFVHQCIQLKLYFMFDLWHALLD